MMSRLARSWSQERLVVAVCSLLLLLLPGSSSLRLEVKTPEKIPMGQLFPLQVRVFEASMEVLSGEQNVTIRANLTNPNSWAVRLLNSSVSFTDREIKRSLAKSIWLQGDVIGVNNLSLSVEEHLLHTEPLYIVMSNPFLNSLCTSVMIVMVLVNTINMGAQLDMAIIVQVFRKPVGPGVGFISQFLFMPLFSFLVGWLVTEDVLFRLGLFVLGCCPGGTGSNFWTLLLGGDINLSITMTFVSTVAALGMMPLWMFLLGPVITQDQLVIPFGQLIFSLVSLILPTTMGMWIRWRWPPAAKVMEKIIVPFTLLTLIFILTAGVYINLFIFLLITPLMVAAGFAVALAGYGVGALLAWLFRLELPQITAVAIETSFQNASIAFILLKMSLEEPLGELAAVAPVAQLMITGIPLWIIFGFLKLYQKCYRKENKEEVEYSDVPTIDRL